MGKDLSAPLLRTARLLDLVPFLNSNQGISVHDLAKAFGVSAAQIHSDLTTLWMCGLPGYTPLELMDLEFESGYVTIRNAQTLSQPRNVSFDEGLALMLGLEMLQQQIPADRSDLQSAIEVLKERFSKQIGVPRAVTVSHAINPSIIAPLKEAITASKDVEITYHSLYSDEITLRKISPLAIFHENGNSYLRAFCRTAMALRVFKLDRIQSLVKSDIDHVDPDASRNQWSTDDGEGGKITYTIKIKRLTRDVIERFDLTQLLQGSSKSEEITVELSSFSDEWIRRAVLASGSDVELLAPSGIRQEVAGHSLSLLGRYAQK